MIVVACAAISVTATSPLEACLAPNTEVTGLFVASAVPAAHCIRDLLPSSTYEIIISFPGTYSGHLELSLLDAGPFDSHMPGRHSDEGVNARGRRLLDTEKTVFATNAMGDVQHPDLAGPTPQRHVRVYIRATGSDSGVRYNIRLDDVDAGALPAIARPLIVTVACSLLLTVAIVSWLFHSRRSPLVSAELGAAAKAS